MPVPAPEDKRFRRARARVRPARRGRWRPAISWRLVVRAMVIAAVLGFVGYKTVVMALSAEALTISTIKVSGNTRVSKGEVLALLDGLSGQNMVTVDLEEWREKLLRAPWVADAAVRRMLPGTVSVVIAERQPLALGRSGDDLYLLDQGGEIIDVYGPNYSEFDLPIIDGIASRSRRGEVAIDQPRVSLAVQVLAALQARSDLAGRVSQIDVSDSHDAVVLLEGDTTLVRIGDTDFVERLQAYVDLAPSLRERIPDIDYVDLRFGDHLYVRPRGGAAAVQTVARKGD